MAYSLADHDQLKEEEGESSGRGDLLKQLSYPPASYLPTTPKANPSTVRPRAAYYISQLTPLEIDEYHDDGIILRVLLFGLFLLAIILCTTAVTWLVLNPKLPACQVHSLYVSNFNVSIFGIRANWDLNIGVKNPNEKLEAVFDKIGIYMTYKGVRISKTEGKSFKLGIKEQRGELAHLQRVGQEKKFPVGNPLLRKMGQDRKSGAVSFGLEMEMPVIFQVDESTLIRQMKVRIKCEDLKVPFMAARGVGLFESGMNCTSHEYK